jgi:hypothetical protein
MSSPDNEAARVIPPHLLLVPQQSTYYDRQRAFEQAIDGANASVAETRQWPKAEEKR